MAIETKILSGVSSRREHLYRVVNIQGVIGTDEIYIHAGWNLEVPNHWDMIGLRFDVVTDATVANRTFQVRKVLNDLETLILTTDAITASLTEGGYYYLAANDNKVTTNPTKRLSVYENNFLFAGDDYIRFRLGSGVAGDVWGIMATFLWKNFQLGLDWPEMFNNKGYPK